MDIGENFIGLWDFILTPIFLLVILVIARQRRDKKYKPGHPLRKYFLAGLTVKLFGAIFIGVIYQFYYGYGDTFFFFHHTKLINSSLSESPATWFRLLTRAEMTPEMFKYISPMQFYWSDPASYTVSAIGAVLGLITFTTYLPTSLLYACLSFSGIWAMFKTFARIYPLYIKELAIAFLFIPSLFVWGSGIFKDTLCMFGLGWLTYTTFRIFVDKDYSIKNILLLFISFYLLYKIKVYILLAFLPALAVWLLITYSARIKTKALRYVATFFFILVSIGSFLLLAQVFANELERYSLERIVQTAETTRGWIAYSTETQDGSGYDLGAFDPSFTGMLSKFPQAVNVTLYRPYLWEARKPLVLFSALEAFAFLILTFMTFKQGILKSFRKIFSDPNLFFFFTFSIIFAFAIGISTYNFGSLSRYKIPCLPFFAAMLLIVYKSNKLKKITRKPDARKRIVHHIT
jgi:hypothetical protein